MPIRSRYRSVAQVLHFADMGYHNPDVPLSQANAHHDPGSTMAMIQVSLRLEIFAKYRSAPQACAQASVGHVPRAVGKKANTA